MAMIQKSGWRDAIHQYAFIPLIEALILGTNAAQPAQAHPIADGPANGLSENHGDSDRVDPLQL